MEIKINNVLYVIIIIVLHVQEKNPIAQVVAMLQRIKIYCLLIKQIMHLLDTVFPNVLIIL